MLVDRGLAEPGAGAGPHPRRAGRGRRSRRRQAGQLVDAAARVRLKGEPIPTSRAAALKLAHALDHFALDCAGCARSTSARRPAASPTCCSSAAPRAVVRDRRRLQPARVVKLRRIRASRIERANARHLDVATLPFAPDLVVCDVVVHLARRSCCRARRGCRRRRASRSSRWSSRSSRSARARSARAAWCATRDAPGGRRKCVAARARAAARWSATSSRRSPARGQRRVPVVACTPRAEFDVSRMRRPLATWRPAAVRHQPQPRRHDSMPGAKIFAQSSPSASGAIRLTITSDYDRLLKGVLVGGIAVAWMPPLIHARAANKGALLGGVSERNGVLVTAAPCSFAPTAIARRCRPAERARAAWPDPGSGLGLSLPASPPVAAGVDPQPTRIRAVLRQRCRRVPRGRQRRGRPLRP